LNPQLAPDALAQCRTNAKQHHPHGSATTALALCDRFQRLVPEIVLVDHTAAFGGKVVNALTQDRKHLLLVPSVGQFVFQSIESPPGELNG
jgi:hypothetical protein